MFSKELVPLHNHSCYSLVDALPSPKEWCIWCLENKIPAFAITDHGMASSLHDILLYPKYIEEYNKSHKTNYPLDAVKAIPAIEVYYALNPGDKNHFHLNLWAVNEVGYYNLMKISSLCWDDVVYKNAKPKARINYEVMKPYMEGIKVGTACVGSTIGILGIKEENVEEAEKQLLDLVDKFGRDNIYLEIQPVNLTHEWDSKNKIYVPNTKFQDYNNDFQTAYNRFMYEASKKHNLKIIPTSDAHFIRPEEKIYQDVLLRTGNGFWTFHKSAHQYTTEMMFEHINLHFDGAITKEEFETWIDYSHELIPTSIPTYKKEYHLPKIDIPQAIQNQTQDYNSQLLLYTMERIKHHKRWIEDPVYIDRFNKEIDVIANNSRFNFLSYFLMYEDITEYARKCGEIVGLARGSAGGSLLSYYLRLINVDPIKENLPFERFLSHARINADSTPDIDTDFSDRNPVLKYLASKYNLGFAQLCTFQTMKIKSAIKDVMWCFYSYNRNHPVVTQICETIEDSPQGVKELDYVYGFTDSEGVYTPGIIETNEVLKEFFETYPRVEDACKRLLGIVRSIGRHASGFIISTLDLSSKYTPTMKVKEADFMVNVTQFEAPMCEKLGLVKFDLLGVKTIGAVKECMALVKRDFNTDLMELDQNNVEFIYRIPEDPIIFQEMKECLVDSAFQFGTNMVKKFLPTFKPSSKKECADLTALVRPGSLDALIETESIKLEDKVSATQYYIDVKNGITKGESIHSDLDPILEETNYVIVYQEQVMKILVDICGYSLEESDAIRSAIGKKKKEVILATFTKIREITKDRGWTEKQSELLCSTILAFSRYSFNRSHSVGYGYMGYITMWLKHYYPIQWWCSVLNIEDDADKIKHYVSLNTQNLESPSINISSSRYEVANNRIISPINAIKNIGPVVTQEITSKRPFSDFQDFLNRVSKSKCNKRHFSILYSIGAFEEFIKDDPTNLLREYESFHKVTIDPEYYSQDPIEKYLREAKLNEVFNIKLINYKGFKELLLAKTDKLIPTGKASIPFVYANQWFFVGAYNVLDHFHDKLEGKTLVLMGLWQKQFTTNGVAKKSGKAYVKNTIRISDGIDTIDCVNWNDYSTFDFKENTIVLVLGTLKSKFNGKPQFSFINVSPL